MRVILQRVLKTTIEVEQKIVAEIEKGYLIFLGIEENDVQEDIDWLCKKIISLRIFNDAEGKMNLDINEVNGEICIVSQFTLFASCKKGNRPSFIKSAKPTIAIPLYEKFIATMQDYYTKEIKTGIFGADMKINLINDGPVTLILDSKNKE